MSYSKQLPLAPDRASLDRIDSNKGYVKGYVKGNVQFIAFQVQCAKHAFSSEQLMKLCESVASNA